MSFNIPKYKHPDFSKKTFKLSPVAKTVTVEIDGVAPDNYHATSNYPEYVKVENNKWLLAEDSRMDCVLVLKDGQINVVEFRNLRRGDQVVIGRTENAEEGIYVHTEGFDSDNASSEDKFAFRTRGTRESPFSRSYDFLYDLLRYEKENGHISWVLGPAVAFDKDSRDAMEHLISEGFCHSLLAGNALATHDIEAAIFRTGLGQNIYDQSLQPLGHYNHLDILNMIRRYGSIKEAMKYMEIKDGIIYACEKNNIPYVLAGSIRDDGPMPEVIADVYKAQDAMRNFARKTTTVIAMATQLHTIAFGNMTPSYRVLEDGTVRPVYFYIVDMSEFSADKLANRGSAQAHAILTNAQDFVVNLWNNLTTKNK
jgi:lysine-ketoglutarate reductase/saccharopine dehydrogenase-like protein (TIGR00300 family)